MIFAWLEFRTMLFMTGLLAVALSILLLAINSRTAILKGLKEWVCANLLLGAGIMTFTLIVLPLSARAEIGGFFIVAGLGLYLIAIRIFDKRPIASSTIRYVLFSYIIAKFCITLFTRNEYVLVVFDTALCIVLTAATALYLLKHSPKNHSSEHRFTAAFFILFTLITLIRFYILSVNSAAPVEHLTAWTLNQITFLACMLSALAINFGFIAMVNAKLAELLTHTAGHDWLTGVMNRGNLEKCAELLTIKTVKYKQTQAMLIMDLDHFKKINDTHGHLFGDEVIQTFARLAQDNMRDEDLLGRYGGEEFCIIMPNSTEAEALILAERIRQKFAEMTMMFDGQPIKCTVSAGVCDSSRLGHEFKRMFSGADESLYAAKNAGRNRVFAYSSLA